MSNCAWTLIIWWKRKVFDDFVKCLGLSSLNRIVFSFKIYFSFYFCSDLNLEATIVKTDEIRSLKQLFTPWFLLNEKKNFPKWLIIITTSKKSRKK